MPLYTMQVCCTPAGGYIGVDLLKEGIRMRKQWVWGGFWALFMGFLLVRRLLQMDTDDDFLNRGRHGLHGRFFERTFYLTQRREGAKRFWGLRGVLSDIYMGFV